MVVIREQHIGSASGALTTFYFFFSFLSFFLQHSLALLPRLEYSVAESHLTATVASWLQEILVPQLPK